MAPIEPIMPAELAAPDHHHGPSTRRRSQSASYSSLGVLPGARSASRARSNTASSGLRARLGLMGVARRTLGIVLLLVTVFLWTLSNFLASVSVGGTRMAFLVVKRKRANFYPSRTYSPIARIISPSSWST